MCRFPLTINENTFKCGQCKECLLQRSRQWAMRLDQEALYAKTAHFITLTYMEQEVPIIDTQDDQGNEVTVTTLEKDEMQRFVKRLRHHQSRRTKDKIRVFYTGEYGSKTKRAHYHLMVFDLHPELTSYKDIGNNKPQWDKKIARIWKKGNAKTGKCTSSSIRYVSNYMLTKNIDVIGEQEKPFMEMSRNPGIGYQYVKHQAKNHWNDGRYTMEIPKPKKYRPNLPAYYAKKIFDTEQLKIINEWKTEDYEQYMKEIFTQAESQDKLDPLGWIRKMKELRENKKKKPDYEHI